MPPTQDNALNAYSEHEKLTATRMHWWGVYLVREQRRLQGIADRVRAQEAAKATGHKPVPLFHQEYVESARGDLQTVPGHEGTSERLLTRLDAEVSEEGALSELEAFDDQDDGSKAY
jgi:hypothetical protein